MNISIPLLALLAAQRQGGSPNDSGRTRLIAKLIRPPILGVLMATEMAEQAALLLKAPIVRRTLKKSTRKDARAIRQLEQAVRSLHHAIDGIRDGRAVNGRVRRKRSRTA